MISTFVVSSAVISSLLLRLSAYIFLRWIPTSIAPMALPALLVTYLTSFFLAFQDTSGYKEVVEIIETKEIFELEPEGDIAEAETLEIVEKKEDPHILRTLLTGLPSPTSSLWSYITLGINLALVLMCLDHIYRAPLLHQAHDLSFARVGYVSHNSAKVLVREPYLAQLPLKLHYRLADTPLKDEPGLFSRYKDASWHATRSIGADELSEDTDFTSVFQIRSLTPDTRYQYALSNNHTGYFRTAPAVGTVSKTNGGKFTFVHSSCIKPRVPYNPLDHPLRMPGLGHLASWVPKLHAHFMLFLGDFIYVDVPVRLGSDVKTYRQEYRQMYASPDWPSVSDDLPWLHVIDDHEISNDWDKNTTGIYQAAMEPWTHYNLAPNPPRLRKGHSWFQFDQGLASFFLMDTRRYRSPETNDPNDPSKTMLGALQLADLLAFIREEPPRGVQWKVIASSIPFTKNWHFGGADTWGGYLHERQQILEALWDLGLKGGVGVVILSGDRHEFAATAFPPPAGGRWPVSATVHEFSTSPLSMFYLPVRTYKQTDDTDVQLKYLPDGNSKFGAIEITSPAASEQSMLQYRLIIDGVEAWSYTLTTPPPAKVFNNAMWD